MEKKKLDVISTDLDGVYTAEGGYYTWEEVEYNESEPDVAYLLPTPEPKIIKFKCKPTFNFQSIEFEIECADNNLTPMFALYRKIIEELIKVTPDQPKNGVVGGKPASQKQLEVMDKFRIPYQPGISYDEANRRIQESYAKNKANRTY